MFVNDLLVCAVRFKPDKRIQKTKYRSTRWVSELPLTDGMQSDRCTLQIYAIF